MEKKRNTTEKVVKRTNRAGYLRSKRKMAVRQMVAAAPHPSSDLRCGHWKLLCAVI